MRWGRVGLSSRISMAGVGSASRLLAYPAVTFTSLSSTKEEE